MIELWGGVECTVNRVHDRWFDQMARSGHDRRVDDLDRFAALGLRAMRYPVLWERMAPRSLDDIEWRWTDERLPRLRELGVEPIVGLVHHGSGPAYTSLVDEEFPRKLARFARAVAERYPWVTAFTPINEPLTTARFSALYGHWYPHGRDDRTFIKALMIQARAVVLAMRAIREVIPQARLVQTEDCGRTFGTRPLARQVAFEGHRRWLTWDLLTGRIDEGHPLHRYLLAAGAAPRDLDFFVESPCAPDVLGLNYYLTSDRFLDDRLDRYPAWAHGGNGVQQYADVEAVRGRADGIAGHEAHLLAAWARYRLPVAITEAHLGCTRDEQMRWLLECWRGAHAARAKGADVRAVTAWALLGSFDWSSLVTRDEGHYEPGVYDVRSASPRLTAVGSLVRALASGAEPDHPVLATRGWWRRPERLIHAPTTRTSPLPAGAPPLLIIGSTGTLGRAFQRICTLRGLRSQLVGRREVDIADPSRVDAVIRKVRPWAVINAAGFVRVDDAECERDACWRSNVVGPVNLAAACRRRGVPLVTFSSDLVFDGTAGRPYVESDPPSPVNVYGASKAEAERRVRELLEDSLIVRTSAFFGPWDEYNFLAAVFRAIDAGERFLAPADTVVSPTYVPDLVHAVLDLLVDGERGIWHLANDGAVTWYELARRAAALAERPVDLIEAADTTRVWSPARRPVNSALASERGTIMPPLEAALTAWLRDAEDARAAAGARACASP